MDRRSVLRSFGLVAIGSVAGCAGSNARDADGASGEDGDTGTMGTRGGGEPTASGTSSDSDAHSVTVTRHVESGTTGLSRELRAKDGGDLCYELTCPDGTTETATATVPASQWSEFERLVLESDVGRFQEQYECSGSCPSDSPGTRLTFEVDGTESTTFVDAAADQPAALQTIRSELDALAEHLDRPTCG